MSKQPPTAPTASAIGPCPTIIRIVGRPGTGSLPRTIVPPDQPQIRPEIEKSENNLLGRGAGFLGRGALKSKQYECQKQTIYTM